MSSSAPLVSICCIAFNHERFIRHALDGFLMQQTSFQFEIIVHDDASTDGTAAVIREYETLNPGKIRPIIQEENLFTKEKGRVTRNVLEAARGKYIAWCEGDDYWTDPLKLQKQVDFLEANPTCAATYHDAVIVNEDGKVLATTKVPDIHKRDHSQEDLQRAIFMVASLSLVCRRIPEMSNLPPEFNHVRNGDSFLIMLLGAHGSGHYMKDVKPAVYRRHEGGVWSTWSKTTQARIRLNTLMWMAAYHNRMGHTELAAHYIELVNANVVLPFVWMELKHRRSYRWFVKVMGWFGVGLPH